MLDYYMYTTMSISGNSAIVFHGINLVAIVTGVLEFYISRYSH